MTLKNRTVVVVGGASGMGFATAERLQAEGAEVVLVGRSEERLSGAAQRLGGPVRWEVADFSREDEVARLFERIGKFDHLVLCASSAVAWGPFENLQADAVRAAFDNKFWGYWYSAQHALPRLATDGSMVMVTGAAHRTAMPGTTALAAVNAAIAQFAVTLAAEAAPRRINVVSPGLVDTPAYDGMPAEQKQGMFADAAARLPVGRVGRSEEIASVIMTLLGNGFITGTIVDVDGGARLAKG